MLAGATLRPGTLRSKRTHRLIAESFRFVLDLVCAGKIDLLQLIVVENDLIASRLADLDPVGDYWIARMPWNARLASRWTREQSDSAFNRATAELPSAWSSQWRFSARVDVEKPSSLLPSQMRSERRPCRCDPESVKLPQKCGPYWLIHPQRKIPDQAHFCNR